MIATVVGAIHFKSNSDRLRSEYVVQGIVGGILTLFGTLLAICALNVEGAPMGPVNAILNAQIMILLVADLIIKSTFPTAI